MPPGAVPVGFAALTGLRSTTWPLWSTNTEMLPVVDDWPLMLEAVQPVQELKLMPSV